MTIITKGGIATLAIVLASGSAGALSLSARAVDTADNEIGSIFLSDADGDGQVFSTDAAALGLDSLNANGLSDPAVPVGGATPGLAEIGSQLGISSTFDGFVELVISDAGFDLAGDIASFVVTTTTNGDGAGSGDSATFEAFLDSAGTEYSSDAANLGDLDDPGSVASLTQIGDTIAAGGGTETGGTVDTLSLAGVGGSGFSLTSRTTIDLSGVGGAYDADLDITVSTVPLPAPALLLLGALGGTAWLGRRLKAA